MSETRGRPPKSAGGITLSRTRIFQREFSDEDVKAFAAKIKEDILREDISVGERVKAITVWARYCLVSADVEAATTADKEKLLSEDRKKELIDFIQNGGSIDI